MQKTVCNYSYLDVFFTKNSIFTQFNFVIKKNVVPLRPKVGFFIG
jgi:hypothetical protein